MRICARFFLIVTKTIHNAYIGSRAYPNLGRVVVKRSLHRNQMKKFKQFPTFSFHITA